MMFGGMVGQVIIQALILRAILYLLAKHEADTSLPKVAMVVAGVTLGNVLIMAMLSKYGVLVVYAAQIMFMAVMIGSFCWISFWKSVLVVISYVAVHFVIVFVQVLIINAIFGSPQEAAKPKAVAVMEQIIEEDEKAHGPKREHVPLKIQDQGAMETEALRLKAEADRKRTEAEAMMRELEEADSYPVPVTPPAAPAQNVLVPPPVTSPVTPVVAVPHPKEADQAKMQDEKAHEWALAREKIKISGFVSQNNKHFVRINGKMMEEGEVVAMVFKGSRYRWKIGKITGSQVQLDQLDVVPVP